MDARGVMTTMSNFITFSFTFTNRTSSQHGASAFAPRA
jgi:hypothetical protein